MFLETERLVLRKFREKDFDDFCEFVMDPERNRLMGNHEINSADDARDLLEWFLHGEKRAYAIVYKENGKVIGDLTVYDSPPVENLPQLAGKTGRALSFSISRAYRRRGLISEAVTAVVRHLFEAEGVDYVNSGYLDFNAPSRELHQKLGFTYLTTQGFRREDGPELTSIEMILWKE